MLISSARTRREDTDVVIVGGGPAGLAAARHLTGAGLDVTVLEAESRVGGRMTTDSVDGYRLDRGTGLLCPDWPALAELRHLGLDSTLALRPFAPGALLRTADRLLRIGDLHPVAARIRGTRGARGTRSALSAARALTSARGRAAVGDALDLARLRSGLARLANTAPERLLARPELSAGRALSARGLPSRTLAQLVHPLLAALLSDPGLTTSSRVADIALRGFARAGLCLPAGGASALPEILAAGLPENTVRTGVRAVSVSANSVRTDGHGTLGCRAVLVATDARDAAQLLPGLRVPDFHPVTVLHHAADEPPPGGRSLLVDAHCRGPVSHTWASSAVDPSRTEPGRTLVTSVVLGPAATDPATALDKAVRPQLADVHGVSTDRWELLACHYDAHAVPATPVPHDTRRPVRVLCGLYVCGDHRDASSPQGALASARRAAGEILRDFGLRPVSDDDPELSAVA